MAALAVATGTIVAGIAAQVYDLTTFGLAWRDHAYGSIVYTLAAFLLALLLATPLAPTRRVRLGAGYQGKRRKG